MARAIAAFGFIAAAVLTLVGEGCGPQAGSGSQAATGAVAQAVPADPATGAPQAAGRPGAGPVAKPSPPLNLSAPPEPSPTFNGKDLTKFSARQLAGAARQLYDDKKYPQAIQLLHHAIKAGADGGYDLACDYALNGQGDAAFYWLQKTALEEGVDASWAGQDSDLDILRKDARWSRIAPYLSACNAYWAGTGHHSTTLVVPTGYKPGTPIGVLVGMHGLGADPEGFVSPDGYQDLADELNVAVVGVSGTRPRGKRSFVWSEDPAQDAAQIRRALEELKDKVTVASGQVIAFGFSQGAQMAFEVAFANPGEYRGAIVMSPGTSKVVTRAELKPGPANTKQAFVFTCGAAERPGNVLYTRGDAEFARKAGCRVEEKLYEGVSEHRFPADFAEAFPRWVRFIRGEKAPAGPKP
jgi:predicted esterase